MFRIKNYRRIVVKIVEEYYNTKQQKKNLLCILKDYIAFKKTT